MAPPFPPRPCPAAARLAPSEVARRCAHLPEFVWFDRAAAVAPGAVSILAAFPREIVRGRTPADWGILREKWERARRGQLPGGEAAPQCLAAGYVEYDGLFRFGLYDSFLIYDHDARVWREAGDFWSKVPDKIPGDPPSHGVIHFHPETSREHYCCMVEQARRYIAAGDIYQVNLARRFTAAWDGRDPFGLYLALRRSSPAPEAAYLRTAERAVLSASPESFLQISGRHIRTRPIKGTRPRHADACADALSARELTQSAKEKAELTMITDLERNDLGQVCEYGSVKVAELLKLERFAQVFHLVSTVEGTLRAGVDHLAALQACFPGGSITGAPKKRAREIIAELESGPRGLYTGALGYFGCNGESRFSIAIRTVVIDGLDGRQPARPQASFHTGAGIVADSDPRMEYEETLHKAAGILLAAGMDTY